MASEKEYQELLDRVAAFRATLVDRLGSELLEKPELAEAIQKLIDDQMASVFQQELGAEAPPDRGLAQLAGVGPDAARRFGQTRIPAGVEPYDERVTSERIVALGDLYYIYTHERIGVLRAVQKLQELFRNGTVRLSGGEGAFALYQFDRREVLRYTRKDRFAAYRRAFGYGGSRSPSGAKVNVRFHGLFGHFARQVAMFWRDKRISDVIRERAQDPSFGSIAVVRRAGLDLRNNLKEASYGHLNVLRVEVMQLLEEAFQILGTPDVRRLFGAENAWDVVDEIQQRYFQNDGSTSSRQRMAVAGREIFRWLAQSHILETSRAEFEALLLDVAEDCEEWLTSAESLGVTRRKESAGIVRRSTAAASRLPSVAAREFEW